jgi:catalase-peroxidase
LLDMNAAWEPVSDANESFEGRDRKQKALKWTATRADLRLGCNAVPRAIAEVYACSDALERSVQDFVAAW